MYIRIYIYIYIHIYMYVCSLDYYEGFPQVVSLVSPGLKQFQQRREEEKQEEGQEKGQRQEGKEEPQGDEGAKGEALGQGAAVAGQRVRAREGEGSEEQDFSGQEGRAKMLCKVSVSP